MERTRLAEQYKFLPGSGVFKINTISDPNYKAILEHVAKLMLASDTGFVMKKYDENIGNLESYLAVNTEMIMAFTREHVLARFFSNRGFNRIKGMTIYPKKIYGI